MKNKFRKIINTSLFTLLGCFLLFFPFYTLLAQDFEFDPGNNIQKRLNLPNPKYGPESIATKVIQWILGILGLVAVVMIILGGFIWMTAAGNEEKVRKAKAILTSAIIGLVIVLLSFAILILVVRTVNNVTT